LAGQEHIPVACGSETPLAGDHVFPSSWRNEADNAYGVAIPDGGEASLMNAPQLISDILQNSTGKTTIVAVGPLTNIAETIQNYPDISSKIDMIYIMGGAIEITGNVGPSDVGIKNFLAEWNIYIDPLAANIVFDSGLPVTLVPLNATKDVPVTRDFYEALDEHRASPEADWVYEILTVNLGFVDSGGFQFWDSLTAAIFTDESLATYEEFPVTVVEEEGPESGYTREVNDGTNITVAMSADRARFEQLFLTILNWAAEFKGD
jgi:inosine-uridine nucleoside N-ribohydrolase